VEANILASQATVVGGALNIGGGTTVTLNEAIGVCEEVSGKRAKLDIHPVAKGDVRQTLADVSQARQHLGYQPKVDLREGLAAEWQWVRHLYRSAKNRQG